MKKEELYGNIHTMLDAGLNITRALEISVRGSKGQLRPALIAVANDIEKGSTLTNAMCRHPRVFSKADVSIIEAGEVSGRLDESFLLLANWHQLKNRTRNVILSGLALPALQLHIAALLLPVPAFVFGSMTLGGYLMTVILIVFIVLYLPVGTILFICRISDKQGSFRQFLDPFLLKLPILGTALEALAFARYCEAFYALHNAGSIPMADCADTAVEICNNTQVAAMLKGGGMSARNGYPVSAGFSENIPHDFLNLWQTGEQVGKLAETLQHLSSKKQDQAKQSLKELGGLVPQMCMLLITLIIVGLILLFRG